MPDYLAVRADERIIPWYGSCVLSSGDRRHGFVATMMKLYPVHLSAGTLLRRWSIL